MPSVILDTVKNSELEIALDFARYNRGGYIDNIDLVGVSDAEALVRTLPLIMGAAGGWNSILGPTAPGLRLTRARLLPESAKFKRINFVLIYETTTADFTPTFSTIRDRTFSIQDQRPYIPGTYIPIICSYIADETQNESKANNIINEPLLFDINISARSIQLATLMVGRPEETLTGGTGNFVNYVNDDDWPTQDLTFTGTFGGFGITTMKTARSLPKGYWRINSYQTDYNRQNGYTLVTAEAITKGIEDWSNIGYLKNPTTGKFPFAAFISEANRNILIQNLSAREYVYGYIFPVDSDPIDFKGRGIIRFGAYPTVSFPARFGNLF